MDEIVQKRWVGRQIEGHEPKTESRRDFPVGTEWSGLYSPEYPQDGEELRDVVNYTGGRGNTETSVMWS